MKQDLRVLAAAGSLLLGTSVGETAFAQKQGGVLRMSHFDSPASMSLHEEATAAANRPMMGVSPALLGVERYSKCADGGARWRGFSSVIAGTIARPPRAASKIA